MQSKTQCLQQLPQLEIITKNSSEKINFIASEYCPDSFFRKVTPSDVINLFSSVSPEFGNGEIKYLFDNDTDVIMLRLQGVSPSISILGSNKEQKWTANGNACSFVMKAVCRKDLGGDDIAQLSEANYGLTLYPKNGHVICECSAELASGVPTLNLMDLVARFLTTVVGIS